MDSDPVEISFAKNGMHQGIAYTIPKEELAGEALYPHILSKNMFMEINFGQEKGKEYNKLPPNYEDYVMIGKLPLDKRVRAPKEPQDSSECEVIMMCGLPGAGKTYWALNHMKENPDKKYVLLGKHSILEKMKINGEPFKNHCTGKWDETVETALVCLVKLLSQAHESKRNYILDQDIELAKGLSVDTPVFPSLASRTHIESIILENRQSDNWSYTVWGKQQGRFCILLDCHSRLPNFPFLQTNAYTPTRRAKLNPFEGYKKKAIVVVPSDEEFKKRTEKLKKDGSYDIQDYAVLEYKAVLELPSGKEDYLDEVIYPELNEEEAKKLVDKYNEEGRSFRKRNQSFYNEYLSQGSGRGYIKQYRGGGGYGRGGGYNDYGHNARHHPYSMNHRGSNYHHEGNYNPHRPRR
ncbi:HNRNPU, partial [Cordylochernes scorpioides]